MSPPYSMQPRHFWNLFIAVQRSGEVLLYFTLQDQITVQLNLNSFNENQP